MIKEGLVDIDDISVLKEAEQFISEVENDRNRKKSD